MAEVELKRLPGNLEVVDASFGDVFLHLFIESMQPLISLLKI